MKQESAAERYLRRATRGLWGHKRLEVREELSGHLEERVTAYRIGGLSEAEATERALADLGAPQHVSHGMVRLYTLPTVMGSSLILMALCLAFVALWPKGTAQTLSGTAYWPSEPCAKALALENANTEQTTCFSTGGEFWVSQKQLQNALTPQGVKFTRVLGPSARLLSISIPGTTPIFLTLGSNETSAETVLLQDGRSFTRAEGYFAFWELVEKFALNDDARFSVSGWNDPIVHLNDVTFHLQDENNIIAGHEFYLSYLMTVVGEGLVPSLLTAPRNLNVVLPKDSARFESKQRVSLEVAGEIGDVYGLLSYSKQPKSSPEATIWFQLERVTKDGKLLAWLPQGKTDFISSFERGEDLNPGQVILIRLAGGNPKIGGWYEIVSPENVSLETP